MTTTFRRAPFVGRARPTFAQLVASKSPLVSWKFDENFTDGTNQTAVDSSGNGRNGSINSSSYNKPRIVRGTSPGATMYNSSGSSRVALSHASWMDTTATTAILIHKPATVSTGYLMSIDDGGSGNGEMSWNVLRGNDGTFTLQHRTAGGTVASVVGGKYLNNVPIVLGYSLSAAGEFLFVNGELVLTGTAQAPRVGTGALRVGNLNGTSFPGTGWYDEFHLFGSAFTALEHKAFADAALGMLYWANTGSLVSTKVEAGVDTQVSGSLIPPGTSLFGAVPGGTSYVARIPSIPSPFTTSSAQTIELWFTKPASTVNGSFFKVGMIGGGWGLGLGASDMETVGNNLLLIRESLAWHTISAVATGLHHLVATRSGSTIQIYIDGSSVYNANPGTINAPAANDSMSFGGYSANRNLPSTVPIGKVALYDSVLSGARVTAHYNGGLGSNSAVAADNPIVLLDFNQLLTGV